MTVVHATGQQYRQTTYIFLECAVTKDLKLSAEIGHGIRAGGISSNRYQTEYICCFKSLEADAGRRTTEYCYATSPSNEQSMKALRPLCARGGCSH